MKNTRLKQIIAWIAIILLALLYLSTLVVALMGYGVQSSLFSACLIGTIVIPLIAFIILFLVARYNGGKAPGDPNTDPEFEVSKSSKSDDQ